MQNILKQFGAKATDSFSGRFNRSLLRLTVSYSLTIAVILIISGLISYSAISQRIGHRFRSVPSITIPLDRVVFPITRVGPTPEQLRQDLIESLVLVNTSLFFLAVILSYWLAKKTLEPIKNAYEEQQRFLSDASHELRTPIAILQMDLENELLANTDPSHSAIKTAIESKLEEVQRMGKLVNDILSLSRMEHTGGVSKKTFSTISLAAFIGAINKRLQPLAEKMNISLQLIEKTTNITLFTDQDLLLQAVTNILQNAILYNVPGGTVNVILQQTGGQTCIEIVDTGIGLSPNDQEHIFDRFYRVDKSRTRQTGGSGLGLSIVRSAVERLGGDIAITSEVGKGTTITLCFSK